MPKKNQKEKFDIIYVINPVSGDIQKEEMSSLLENYAKEMGGLSTIYYTSGNDDEKNIRELIQRKKTKYVVAGGGDGTCNMIGKILMDTGIIMGILPLGSANGLAKELNIPKDIGESLDLLKIGKIIQMDVIVINGSYISLHLSDIGTNARIVKKFDEDNVRGFYGYLKHFTTELFQSKMMSFRLSIEGKNFYKKAHVLIIANASRYGTGAIINPNGKIDDGVFEVIVVKPYSFWKFIKMIIPFFSGKLHKHESVDVFHCRNITIYNKEKNVFQIDGEVIGNPEIISAEIKPGSIKILVPPSP